MPRCRSACETFPAEIAGDYIGEQLWQREDVHGNDRQRPQVERIAAHEQRHGLAQCQCQCPAPRTHRKAVGDKKDHHAHVRNAHGEIRTVIPGLLAAGDEGNAQADKETAEGGEGVGQCGNR